MCSCIEVDALYKNRPTVTLSTSVLKNTAHIHALSLTSTAIVKIDGLKCRSVANRIGLIPKISNSIVCSTSSEFYLEIDKKIIWLTPDNNFSEDVGVRSNVEWTIQ